MQISIGDLGAIAGVLIYRPEWSANKFRKPHIISIGYLAFAILVTAYLWTWMTKENRRRDGVVQSQGEKDSVGGTLDNSHERVEQGDRYVGWRYQT